MVARHEIIDARAWDAGLRRWRPLHPFIRVELPWLSDWTINAGQLRLAGEHPLTAQLARVRQGVPLPVRFGVNGVIWTGQITRAKLSSEQGRASVWECTVESDHKHAHRQLTRDTAVSAADLTDTRLRGWLGDVTEKLVAGAAQRTGVPTYILVEGEGDPVEVIARTEDTIHDVLQDVTVGSRMHLDVRMLMPEDPLPGAGVVSHYSGVLERTWEAKELTAGSWPHARTNARLVGRAAPHPQLLLPSRSWRGTGSVRGGHTITPTEGICWMPFETRVTQPQDYFAETDPAGVWVATEAELREAQDARPGWSVHVTHVLWWTPGHVSIRLLGGAVADGLVVDPSGRVFDTVQAVNAYVGSGSGAYIWRDGPRWVVANVSDYLAEDSRRRPRGTSQRQTPGLLVHLHPERDRRGVVFSSTPGGGLEAWSVEHSAAEAAMLVAGGQVDERILAAAKRGLLPPSLLAALSPTDAAGVLPSGSTVPGVVERVDVDAQPLASIEGTEVSYSQAGGRVDFDRAGVFFYREQYLSLSTSGGGDPFHEVTRAWSEAQGSSTMSLTPGATTSVVFGDDVRRRDGTIIPGWRPGDRVSFVDEWTRISEVISGYRLIAEHGRLVSAVPVLGRQERGVLAELGARLRKVERDAEKALVSPPRRLPEEELVARAAEQAAAAALEEERRRQAALDAIEAERQAEREALALEEAARQQAQIESNDAAIADLQQDRTYSLFLNHDESTVSNDYMTLTRTSSTRVAWTVKPGWVGHFDVIAAVRPRENRQYAEMTLMNRFYVPNPLWTAINDTDGGIAAVSVSVTVKPGIVRPYNPTIPNQTLSTRTWVTLATWQVPQSTAVTVKAALTWANKTRIATYGLRVTVDGVNATTSSSSGTAPLIHHGPRAASAAMSTRQLPAGSVIRIQAMADHANSLNRQLTGASATITWVDRTATT